MLLKSISQKTENSKPRLSIPKEMTQENDSDTDEESEESKLRYSTIQ